MSTIEIARSVRRFTREEYHRMADAGILDPDERVELIEGEIVTMPAMHSPHAACITRVQELLHDSLRPRASIRIQLPIALGDDSEPEPDFAIVTRREDHYRDAHPGPGDVLFLIEAMDSSRYDDRRRKVPMYARYGIREIWLVDLVTSNVDVCTNPSGRAYASVETAKRGDSIRPLAFPDAEFSIDTILG